MQDRSCSRIFLTHQQLLMSSVLLMSHKPNMWVISKFSQGTKRCSSFFVNLDVSCTVRLAACAHFSPQLQGGGLQLHSSAFLTGLSCIASNMLSYLSSQSLVPFSNYEFLFISCLFTCYRIATMASSYNPIKCVYGSSYMPRPPSVQGVIASNVPCMEEGVAMQMAWYVLQNRMEWQEIILRNFLGINYGKKHSLMHLIYCLEHPASMWRIHM